MPRPKSKCVICDAIVSIRSPRGWCIECETEFEKCQSRIRWACRYGECTTPVTCAGERYCVPRQLRLVK